MTAIDFVRIDRDILTRKDLSDKGKMLLGLITTFNSQGLTLGNEELAEILCVHENSVGRLLHASSWRKHTKPLPTSRGNSGPSGGFDRFFQKRG